MTWHHNRIGMTVQLDEEEVDAVVKFAWCLGERRTRWNPEPDWEVEVTGVLVDVWDRLTVEEQGAIADRVASLLGQDAS